MRPDDRAAAARTTREFFEGLWAEGDHWDLETSELDQQRYARQLALLADRRYGGALELGCGAGAFTRRLAPLCDRLVGLDVAPTAVSRARESLTHLAHVDMQVGDVMDLDAEAGGPWDLVVLAETAYYLGWLYPLFDVGWLVHTLHQATSPGGRLLLVNTYGPDNGLMSRWLVDTYRDLFANTGYRIEAEETMTGLKHGVGFEILLSLLTKDGP